MSDALTIAFIAAIYLGIVSYTAYCAKRFGRSPVVWAIGAAVLGLFALGLLIGISWQDQREKSRSNAV